MNARIRDTFDVDSEVARDLRHVDWAATPLGPPEAWPQSLQTVVRTLLTSRFAMWMAWGPELTFFCNDAYRRDTLGKKYPWALGRSAQEVWAEIWSDISSRIEQVLDTGIATWDEALMLFLERSGYQEETYHTFSYSPLADDSGDIVGLLCVVSEDTERVVAEKRMRILRDLGARASAIASEGEFFSAVSDSLGADLQVLPFTLTYLYDDSGTTARLAAVTGGAAGTSIAPPTVAVDDPDSIWPAAELLRGAPVVVDLLDQTDVPTGDWPAPPEHALVVPLPQQASDVPLGFLVVGVNRYRPLDDDYRGFVEVIAGQVAAGAGSARAYEAERHRADALAELDRAKTTFFTNISHEFRTPLTLLLGPAEDALQDAGAALPDEQRERVEIIHRNGQRLLKLVNTLLDFSRLESGRIDARFEPVDLAAETAGLAASFRAAVERVGLSLTVDCAAGHQPVHVDREMWAKVVLNLLSNALKFTFEGGITVTTREVDSGVEVSVVDTGIGIAAEDQARLFERFHRVSGARSRTHEGSGIGLALVAELVDFHGGTVSVQSTPGAGTAFTIVLPYGTEHLPADHVAVESSSGVDAGRAAQGFLAEAMRWSGDLSTSVERTTDSDKPRVLVVDDNADMRAYVAGLLWDDYDVDVAHDGLEGLERARQHPPDLVLTDVMMPKLDGFGLLRALRDEPTTAAVPVVILSARAGDDATVEGLEAGADDYLVKPFAARELLARVRANLELDRARRTREHIERSQMLLDQAQRLADVGSWELDLASGAVTATNQFFRQVDVSAEDFERLGFAGAVQMRVHPDDRQLVLDAMAAAVGGAPLDYHVRLVMDDGLIRYFHTIGELERDGDGNPVRLRGSNQDITQQVRAQETLAHAVAAQEAAAREHRIADELQRSLLPTPTFDPEHLEVATFYRAGVEGTHVGGDWYDLIELGAGRTALVIGDVMGRGVQAAAVMGQLRAAVRAYARLDMPPADVLDFLDGVVRDLGADQIVTCIYAVYDPGDHRLSYANAGHLPPLLARADGTVQRLAAASGPPLGTGMLALVEESVTVAPGELLVLYTDGLVERRGTDLDAGIDALAGALRNDGQSLEVLPAELVATLRPDEPDDDIALLVARVHASAQDASTLAHLVTPGSDAIHDARRFVSNALQRWAVPASLADDIILLVSELVTNAVIHGRPPVELRVRHGSGSIVLEVRDSATYLPRRLRPTFEDEHGRGLQLVALLADRWGTRAVPEGKAVWCLFSLND